MGLVFPDNVVFRTGIALDDSTLYLLAEDADLIEAAPHTTLLSWKRGEWGKHFLDWIANSCCIGQLPETQLVVTGEDGEYLAGANGNPVLTGTLESAYSGANRSGPLRSVSSVGGIPFAVGMGGSIFRQKSPQVWVPWFDGLSDDVNVEALDGFAKDDLYCVGRGGQIWQFDGKKWSACQSPTNVILTAVTCAPDGFVYAAGMGGIILRGRGNNWEILSDTTTTSDIWSICWFAESLYFATMTGVFTYNNGDVRYVLPESDGEVSAYTLTASEKVLWSIGGRHVYWLCNDKWERFE